MLFATAYIALGLAAIWLLAPYTTPRLRYPGDWI